MFDSLTFVFGSDTYVLPKINQDKYSGEFYFRNDDLDITATIRHTTRIDKTRGGIKVERHAVDLTAKVFATVSGQPDTIRKQYFVFENDYRDGVSNTTDCVLALKGWFTSTTVGNLLQWAS